MTRIERRSARLGMIDPSNAGGMSGRQVVVRLTPGSGRTDSRVHGAGRCLGMVLDREHRAVLEPDALDGAVEQRAVGDLDIAGQAGIGHGEAMVLAGDLDLAGGQVLDRVVGAMMAERHLLRPAAERQPQHLMAEADAEHRRAAVDQLLDFGHRVDAGCGRIARARWRGRRRPVPAPAPRRRSSPRGRRLSGNRGWPSCAGYCA